MRILITLFLFLLLGSTTIFAQKGDLKKATQLFKEDKYAAAIPYFQKALTTKKNLVIKSKLAYCYKVTNKMTKAATLYEEIVEEERAKTKTYYYYGETLMSSGKYDEAKKWFKKYASIETEDETVDRMIESCDYAKTVPAYFGNVIVNPFLQNSDADDNAPVFWDNGIVFTSDRKGKLKLLDTKSGETGRSYLHLYYSKQLTDGTFGKPKEYVSRINDARKNTGMASFQADGTSMFFTRNSIHLNRQNAYCLQLFEAKGENGKNWKNTEVLSFCSKSSNYMHPAVSPDGQFLFFVSDKAKGFGGTDIYVSKKTKKGWGRPENLGDKINTEGHEGFPFMHQNGKLYFCSKGHLGLGGFDVFVTEMNEEEEWSKPINLGAPINSPTDDVSIFIDEHTQRGMFTSSREGGDDDIFLFSFAPDAIAIDSEPNQPKEEAFEEIKEVVVSKEKIPLAKEEIIPPAAELIEIEETPIVAKSLENTKEVIAIEKEVLIPPAVELIEIEETTMTGKTSEEEKEIIVVEKEEIIPPIEILEKEEIKIADKTNFLETYTWEKSAYQSDLLFGLPTIQFAKEEYFVTYQIAAELDLAASILKKNSSLTIEIGAHAANLGNSNEQEVLTRYRAEAIVSYLEKKGIDRYRIVPIAYGGQQPLNKCFLDIDCSVEEHAVNDRIELKILSN